MNLVNKYISLLKNAYEKENKLNMFDKIKFIGIDEKKRTRINKKKCTINFNRFIKSS